MRKIIQIHKSKSKQFSGNRLLRMIQIHYCCWPGGAGVWTACRGTRSGSNPAPSSCTPSDSGLSETRTRWNRHFYQTIKNQYLKTLIKEREGSFMEHLFSILLTLFFSILFLTINKMFLHSNLFHTSLFFLYRICCHIPFLYKIIE